VSAAEAERPSHQEGEVPFGLASPAEIRAALTPQDAADFDRQWREVLGTAAERLDLTPVLGMLDAWRRVAWMTSTLGLDGYRQLMATANDRARTGTRPAGSVPWQALKAELGL
jgi:cell wall assembly regulator SMI1